MEMSKNTNKLKNNNTYEIKLNLKWNYSKRSVNTESLSSTDYTLNQILFGWWTSHLHSEGFLIIPKPITNLYIIYIKHSIIQISSIYLNDYIKARITSGYLTEAWKTTGNLINMDILYMIYTVRYYFQKTQWTVDPLSEAALSMRLKMV